MQADCIAGDTGAIASTRLHSIERADLAQHWDAQQCAFASGRTLLVCIESYNSDDAPPGWPAATYKRLSCAENAS